MFRNATPEKAVSFTYYCVALACCWPPPPGNRKSEIVFKLFRTLAVVNAAMCLVPTTYSLYVYRNDPENLSVTALIMVALVHIISQIATCTPQYTRFQRVIEEMKLCFETTNELERTVFQEYVDKYCRFYGTCAIWFYSSATAITFGGLLAPDRLPTNLQYPFPVNFEPLHTIVFIQLATALFQCSAACAMSVFCSMTLLFTAARYEILMANVKEIKNIDSLRKCVTNYRDVTRYAVDTADGMAYLVLNTYTAATTACVFATLTILDNVPLIVKAQSFIHIGTTLLEAFTCAFSANQLMEMSENSMRAAFDAEWYMFPTSLQKCVLFMLYPKEKVVLSIKCIMPALTLNYYCKFLTNLYTMYSALRLMLADDDD